VEVDMKFNLININNINIKNSFNKKDNPIQKEKIISVGNSTLNHNKNDFPQVASNVSMGSITGFQELGDATSCKIQKKGQLFSREIFIGIISGTIGTVLGAIISYFIFGIK